MTCPSLFPSMRTSLIYSKNVAQMTRIRPAFLLFHLPLLNQQSNFQRTDIEGVVPGRRDGGRNAEVNTGHCWRLGHEGTWSRTADNHSRIFRPGREESDVLWQTYYMQRKPLRFYYFHVFSCPISAFSSIFPTVIEITVHFRAPRNVRVFFLFTFVCDVISVVCCWFVCLWLATLKSLFFKNKERKHKQ